LGSKEGQKALTAVASGSEDLAIKGSAISTAKTFRTLSKYSSNFGNASGALDVTVSTLDAVNVLLDQNSTTGDKVSAGTKAAIKTTIFLIGMSNPVTGAVLGAMDAFGATDWIANKIGSLFN